MPDVYATIAEADAPLQQTLADVLELRAADPRQREMLAEYTAALDLPDGADVLEVGCGTGAICRFLTTLPGAGRALVERSDAAAVALRYRWHEFGDAHLLAP